MRHADGAMTLKDRQGRALIEEIRPLGARLSLDEQAAYRKAACLAASEDPERKDAAVVESRW